ncbi:unnamed protein product [Rotaria magnacalcarata]|uniref:Uncharacterized protein n=1 Tax=Rotaria magnacalcarata TaxID=392030 RepID=A0A816CN24_9BILA|nr:unnamed protein product [Rotaria magnacalcarata]CAF1624775.1 unnamed protein product [Rotaria magnacalcarata]CAF4017530.1 unnamed protein product [Rotaria magnacalcarata]CAF4024296.1 unnamed protein product [Rotaria magnacalcarata]
MNPHEHLSSRTVENSPQHLTRRQRTHYLKAGQKAQYNQQLLSTLNPLRWPESHYDSPIHIHHRTSESHLYGILHKISNLHLYTIDTESDKPTRHHPHSIPALIQIQAIHDAHWATIIIIEVQHLPYTSTSLFNSIRQICRMIFSPLNKLITWGDLVKKLHPFQQFNLFDISQVTNTFNLQDYFAQQWNTAHPHTADCLARHQPIIEESISDDFLVCVVNSDDLDDEFDPTHPIDDYNTCICPSEIRPYKTKHALWSLPKAVEFTFDLYLDKPINLTNWSCELDLYLQTCRLDTDKRIRQALVYYAISDLFASTHLYFHFNTRSTPSDHLTYPISVNNIQPNQLHAPTMFVIITDSHGKYFPPVIQTPSYKLITNSISGLQWVNTYNTKLCTRSLLLSSSITSILSSCTGVLFLIGTNSVRNTSALQIITQVEDIISTLRSHHPHLAQKTDITVATVFPCYKPSFRFQTHSLLSSNINNYNKLLKNLSSLRNFSILDLPINGDHLGRDGMHLDSIHISYLSNTIQEYVHDLMSKRIAPVKSLRRSRTALRRRYKKRHEKLKQKQKTHVVIRHIDRIWPLKDIKAYLMYKNIKYNRLPEIWQQKLCIQFTNPVHREHAEKTLTINDFDEHSYSEWCSQEH